MSKYLEFIYNMSGFQNRETKPIEVWYTHKHYVQEIKSNKAKYEVYYIGI